MNIKVRNIIAQLVRDRFNERNYSVYTTGSVFFERETAQSDIDLWVVYDGKVDFKECQQILSELGAEHATEYIATKTGKAYQIDGYVHIILVPLESAEIKQKTDSLIKLYVDYFYSFDKPTRKKLYEKIWLAVEKT